MRLSLGVGQENGGVTKRHGGNHENSGSAVLLFLVVPLCVSV
jgi:hypothetical protein